MQRYSNANVNAICFKSLETRMALGCKCLYCINLRYNQSDKKCTSQNFKTLSSIIKTPTKKGDQKSPFIIQTKAQALETRN